MQTKYIAGLVVAALVIGGGSFYGGMQYSASQATAARLSASAAAGAAGGAGRGGARTRGFGGGAAGGGVLNGSIVSNDGQSLTVQSSDGGSRVVFYATSTRIAKTTDGSSSDLVDGVGVVVMGTTNSDGSVTASMIQLRQGGAGFGAAGGSGGPGASASGTTQTGGRAGVGSPQ